MLRQARAPRDWRGRCQWTRPARREQEAGPLPPALTLPWRVGTAQAPALRGGPQQAGLAGRGRRVTSPFLGGWRRGPRVTPHCHLTNRKCSSAMALVEEKLLASGEQGGGVPRAPRCPAPSLDAGRGGEWGLAPLPPGSPAAPPPAVSTVSIGAAGAGAPSVLRGPRPFMVHKTQESTQSKPQVKENYCKR